MCAASLPREGKVKKAGNAETSNTFFQGIVRHGMRKSFKRDVVKALLAAPAMEEKRQEIKKRRERNNIMTKKWKVEGTQRPHGFDRTTHLEVDDKP